MIEEKKIKLDFLGGAMEVGASCILVEIAGYRILLDCGIRQKAGLDPMPDLRGVQEKGGVDAIIISHAHMDHIGTLPVISKAYPDARIYTTSMTIDLTRVLLYDSIKLMNRQEEGIPMYAQKDVEAMLGKMLAVHYERSLEILPGLTLTLYQAGHIAGAACVFLESKDGSLFYTGDFSGFAQNAIEGLRIPKLRPDVTIIESTYGDRLHANRQIEEDRLIDAVQECIESKGKMIIPAFALGRAQEVLLILKKAINKGIIGNTKIYVDGMVRDMNIAFERNPWYLKNALAKRIEKGNQLFYSDQIIAVKNSDDRDALMQTAEPVIFVASSGMLTGGPSVTYARKIAAMENGYLVITGYQDEEAPGRMVQQLLEDDVNGEAKERFLTLDGQRVPVRCHLKKVGLSAHGDQSEIQGILEKLSSRNVFLVHGNAEVIEHLSKNLQLDYRTRIYTPKDGDSETIYLKSPRQQWKRTYPYTMQKKEAFGLRQQDGKELYQYWGLHYPGQKMNVAEVAYIWSGVYGQSDSALEAFQEKLLSEPYFDRDLRRLFLFVCQSEEDMQKHAKKEGWNQQTLTELAQELFEEYQPRKISIHLDLREVALQIDFTGQCGVEYDRLAESYEEKTGYKLVRNLNPNEQAMRQFLYERIQGTITKIAIHQSKELVMVSVHPKMPAGAEQVDDWSEIQTLFSDLTGYKLIIEGPGIQQSKLEITAGEQSGRNGMVIGMTDQLLFDHSEGRGEKDSIPVEQNLAFTCIDAEFADTQIRPYKKGIKSDHQGKYIELSFLSPSLGLMEKERIRQLCDQTGWRFRISDSVNQNGIQNLAVLVCKECDAVLMKTPSYQPMKNCLVLKVMRDDALAEEKKQELIEKLSGCTGVNVQIEMM